VATQPRLTQREIEILKWWAAGKTSDEIALIVNCSKSNIKFHVNNIYLKLCANTKILAVTKAIRLGLVPLDCVKV
jgi:DNA-binding CsgD family transcriptional regulator